MLPAPLDIKVLNSHPDLSYVKPNILGNFPEILLAGPATRHRGISFRRGRSLLHPGSQPVLPLVGLEPAPRAFELAGPRCHGSPSGPSAWPAGESRPAALRCSIDIDRTGWTPGLQEDVHVCRRGRQCAPRWVFSRGDALGVFGFGLFHAGGDDGVDLRRRHAPTTGKGQNACAIGRTGRHVDKLFRARWSKDHRLSVSDRWRSASATALV